MSPDPSSRSQPHASYLHIYVVVRIHRTERLAEKRPLDEDDVMITKAFVAEGDAEAEAARLNGINGDIWRYFVRVARLVPE